METEVENNDFDISLSNKDSNLVQDDSNIKKNINSKIEHQKSSFELIENNNNTTTNSNLETIPSSYSLLSMIKSKIWLQYSLLEKNIGSKNFNLLKISISLIIFILFLLFINLHALSNNNGKNDQPEFDSATSTHFEDKKRVTLNNIFDDTFQLNYQSFKFIRPPPDSMVRNLVDPGLFYTINNGPNNEIKIKASNLFNPEMETDLGTASFKYNDGDITYQISSFDVSYDLNSALIGTNRTMQFRHTKKALYWFRDTVSGTHTPIGNGEFLVNCKYSQTYNYIYYTDSNYDLYIQPVRRDVDELGAAVKVTSDGAKNKILNGVCDWVYQEEVLATDDAVWFAPDDSKLLFLKQFVESVETFQFPKYITKNSENSGKVQEMIDLKYPRPGGNLPKYELQLVDLVTGEVLPITSYEPGQEIIYAVDWITSNSFIVRSSDRESTTLNFNLYIYNNDKARWFGTKIRSIPFKTVFNGYVEKQKPIHIIKKYDKEGNELTSSNLNMILKTTGFAYLAPDENGFQHIHFTESLKEPDVFYPLTSGEYEVLEIVGFNNENNNLYFMSNHAHPMGKHLGVVNLDTLVVDHLQFCDNKERNDCDFDYNEVQLSMTCRWAYRKMMGPSVPELYAGSLKDVTAGIVDMEAKPVDEVEDEMAVDIYVLKLGDTESLDQKLDQFAMPQINFKTMTLEDGVVINYKEYLPPGYDANNNDHKHPLLTHVYGAPGSMTFNSKFSVFFESAVASGLDSIVLEIEPRGTGGKGWSFKQWATRKIGYWEPRDFQEVVKKYISEHENKIIKEKVAIWGWSYGGFITLKTLEYDKGEIFKYGMSVAPVTDWKLYDAIYTERYLGDPNDDSDRNGYKDAIISDINAFKQVTRFLIMTGTGDDNVHALNTYKFIDDLNINEVSNFDMQIFPDSDHKIAFHNANKMVYRKLYKWLENTFNGVYENMAF